MTRPVGGEEGEGVARPVGGEEGEGVAESVSVYWFMCVPQSQCWFDEDGLLLTLPDPLQHTLIRPALLAHDSTRNVHRVTVRLFIANHNHIGDCNTVGCFNKRLITAGGPLTIHTNI